MISNTYRKPLFMLGLSALFTLLLSATLSGQGVEAVREIGRADSIFSLLSKGGVVMIPLALCSILAVTVTMERLVSLSRRTLLPLHLDKEMEDFLEKSGGADIAGAMDACVKSSSPLGSVYRVGLERWEDGPKDADQSMSELASLEVRRMRRSLRSIRLIASISPLLGLLGTVIGMIQAFQTVAVASNSLNKAEMLAEGIYQAMVTTATGLTIAIPTLVVFFYFNNKVDRLAEEMQHRGEAFITRYFRKRFKLESPK